MEETNPTDAKGWHHHYHHHKTKWLLVLLILIAVGVWICHATARFDIGQSKGYQAVFLSNGQVYFGKLTTAHKFFKLTDIYYLQATQTLQQASGNTAAPANPESNIQLVKLGQELHGPEDAMYIERDKILFWENMKDDSKVVDAIKKFQAAPK